MKIKILLVAIGILGWNYFSKADPQDAAKNVDLGWPHTPVITGTDACFGDNFPSQILPKGVGIDPVNHAMDTLVLNVAARKSFERNDQTI